MCFFSSPSAPQVVYQGPSQADIDANNAALDAYRQQSTAQQQQFSAALQKQIDDANAMAEKQRLQLEQDRAQAAAEMAAQQQAAYAVTTTTAEPQGALTTEPARAKDKAKGALKIAPGATAMSQGTGLNIGV
jgi:hypothetical protein